jgi:hypothetical protein
LEVTLGSNLSLVKPALDSGGSVSVSATGASLQYVSSHKLKVTGLPNAGAGNVTIKLRNGALRLSKRSRSILRRGKGKNFTVEVTPTPVSGKGTTTKTKFRVKQRFR